MTKTSTWESAVTVGIIALSALANLALVSATRLHIRPNNEEPMNLINVGNGGNVGKKETAPEGEARREARSTPQTGGCRLSRDCGKGEDCTGSVWDIILKKGACTKPEPAERDGDNYSGSGDPIRKRRNGQHNLEEAKEEKKTREALEEAKRVAALTKRVARETQQLKKKLKKQLASQTAVLNEVNEITSRVRQPRVRQPHRANRRQHRNRSRSQAPGKGAK